MPCCGDKGNCRNLSGFGTGPGGMLVDCWGQLLLVKKCAGEIKCLSSSWVVYLFYGRMGVKTISRIMISGGLNS